MHFVHRIKHQHVRMRGCFGYQIDIEGDIRFKKVNKT